MNREIKFRYWNTITNQMVLNPEMPYKKDWTIKQLFSDRGWIWQQFTGLLDKNGKDIYEGDIVKVEYDLEKEIHEVIYCGDDGYPAFDFRDWTGEINGLAESYQAEHIEMEVIGNIYENPELLTPIK